jgi:hypothetical protein
MNAPNPVQDVLAGAGRRLQMNQPVPYPGSPEPLFDRPKPFGRLGMVAAGIVLKIIGVVKPAG